MPGQSGGKTVKRRSASKSRKRTASKSRKRSVSRPRRTSTKKRTVKRTTVRRSGPVKLNKWQRFLHKHQGKGHSQRQLRTMYRKEYM